MAKNGPLEHGLEHSDHGLEHSRGHSDSVSLTSRARPTRRAGGHDERRMWGGRFTSGPSPELERLNRSLPVDARLWREDVRASQAWALALGEAGVVSHDEAERLVAGLDRLAGRLPHLLSSDLPDEDIHSLVERLLYEEVGELAGKLHTGRSRNDQVATDARLWAMGAARELADEVRQLQEALIAQAERRGQLLMPGYTHLRRAQPIRAGLWLLSHFWRLQRDRERLATAERSASVLPLGSGALAGCPFPIDRAGLAERLGFREISPNSLDAVSDRDWAAELLFSLALLGVHLSGLAEDLILFSSDEFGFVRLDESVTSGSSLMPQKRNPDVFELSRARAAAVDGDLAAILRIKGGLTGGYHRDLQLLKEPLFRGLDRTEAMLTMMTRAACELDVDRTRGRVTLEGMMATDEVIRRTEAGTPFRAAYRAVAKELADGATYPIPPPREILASRETLGSPGNPGLDILRDRLAECRRWAARERRRFDGAMARLTRLPDGPPVGATRRIERR